MRRPSRLSGVFWAFFWALMRGLFAGATGASAPTNWKCNRRAKSSQASTFEENCLKKGLAAIWTQRVPFGPPITTLMMNFTKSEQRSRKL
jgi:hypothetical protein